MEPIFGGLRKKLPLPIAPPSQVIPQLGSPIAVMLIQVLL
jgi:hypothetical protein